jgi:malate synthase
VTEELVDTIIDEELEKIREAVGDEAFGKGRYADARELYREMAMADDFAVFLTLPAYERMP